MSVSIISCPKCHTWVLNDTHRCPHCSTVINAETPEETDSYEQIPENPLKESIEDPCPKCGSLVRRGVVRCWNCQAFMRQDIEEAYQRMQSGPRPVIYSQAEGQGASEAAPVAEPVAAPQDAAAGQDEDDDFDLAPDVALYAQDDDFELAEDVRSQLASAPAPSKPAAEEPADEETYGVSETPETPQEPAVRYEVVEPSAEESADDAERGKATEDVPEVDHSVATGGEALWEIAKEEEATKSRSRGAQKRVKVRPGSILVYCPRGHRIEVQSRHRGKVGRCPKCKAQFTVPDPDAGKTPAEAAAGAEAAQPVEVPNHFADLHLHAVDPTKLKIKPGSLAKAFESIDVCVAEDGLLLVWLKKKSGGLFGGGGKKPDEVRQELLEYLSLGQKLKSAPGAEKHLFDCDELSQMKVVHPTAYAHESMFAGVNVFGPGLIAVRLPKRVDGQIEFLSLTLSQFRKLHEQLAAQCGLTLEYEEDQVPLKDKSVPTLCHYTDAPIRYLENVEFYENDPAFELELVGWKCQACGLTVSEDGRKKENIGGKNAKSIAKAKCPKCKNAFGRNPLYALKQVEAPAAEAAESEE